MAAPLPTATDHRSKTRQRPLRWMLIRMDQFICLWICLPIFNFISCCVPYLRDSKSAPSASHRQPLSADKKDQLRERIGRYVKQLTVGCGRPNCPNPDCASNAAAPRFASQTDVLKRAVDLLKQGKPLDPEYIAPSDATSSSTGVQPMSVTSSSSMEIINSSATVSTPSTVASVAAGSSSAAIAASAGLAAGTSASVKASAAATPAAARPASRYVRALLPVHLVLLYCSSFSSQWIAVSQPRRSQKALVRRCRPNR